MPNPFGPPMGISRKGDRMNVHFPTVSLTVAITVRPVRGVPEIVGIEAMPLPRSAVTDTLEKFLPGGIQPDLVITSKLLRELPLRELKQMFFARKEDGEDPFAAFKGPRRQGRSPLSKEFLEHVSQTYKRAIDEGMAPLKAVEDAYSVSRAGASKYVRRAREAGLLAWPARPGVAGASNPVSPITGQGATNREEQP